MTQEEKAKAYDEALEQARKLLLGNEHSNTIRSYFEHIFPELRESEEIIRKAVKEVWLTQHQIDWFKTNVFPPKQEWSKEDEKMLKNILWVLESYISKGESAASPSLIVSYPTYYKEIDWLKSLRPQPHWKPSEEQMCELNWASKLSPILGELYEQLKKL